MQYILSTLKEMACREAENQDPQLSLGFAVMSNVGRTYSCLIRNIYSPNEDIDTFLGDLVNRGESRVSVAVCVTPEGHAAYPPRSLCHSLEAMNGENRMGTQIFCPEEDGSVKAKYLSTLLRTL